MSNGYRTTLFVHKWTSEKKGAKISEKVTSKDGGPLFPGSHMSGLTLTLPWISTDHRLCQNGEGRKWKVRETVYRPEKWWLPPRSALFPGKKTGWGDEGSSRKERHCALLNIVKIQKIHFGEEYFLGNWDKYFEWGYNTKKFTLEKNVFLELRPVRTSISNGAITRS